MSTINVNDKQEWKNKFKLILSQLGSALMLPLSFLAFSSLLLGITYTLPSDWFITNYVGSITGGMFSIFTYLAFISLVITFYTERKKYSIISSVIFLLTLIIVQKLSGTNSTFSLFSAMIASSIFIVMDSKLNIHSTLWVLIGIAFSLVLIPTYIIIDMVINIIGKAINFLPWGTNAFLYGFINRLLLPFGLHSVMIPTFTYSPVGGTLEVYDSAGELFKTIEGDSPIWMYMYTNGVKDFAQSGSITIDGIGYTYNLINNNAVGQYQEGFLPIISFSFPILAISYCLVNGFEKGKMLLIGSLMTMFSGVTETTEYFFILLNPFLYILNAVIVGLSFMLCNVLNVHVWLSTGWIIDIAIFGLVPAIKGFQTNWWMIPVIGIALGALYAPLFILIDKKTKFNIGE